MSNIHLLIFSFYAICNSLKAIHSNFWWCQLTHLFVTSLMVVEWDLREWEVCVSLVWPEPGWSQHCQSQAPAGRLRLRSGGVSTPIWTEDLHGIMPPQPRQSDQPFYCRIKILAGWTLSDRITLLKKHRAEYCHLELGGKVNTHKSQKYINKDQILAVPF